MAVKYLSLCFLIIIYLITVTFGKLISYGYLSENDINEIYKNQNTESLFSLGLKIGLSKLNREDLEQIPGLTEKSKELLIHKKYEVLAYSDKYNEAEKYKAFQKIKDIGSSKAKQLAAYLAFE